MRPSILSWKNESLDKLFNAESIAVIGASDKSEKLGALTLKCLEEFKGRVFPVNPRLDKIGELKCYPSITEVNDQVDMAIICLGAHHIIRTLEQCIDAGVRSAIIFSAGFKELGPEGEKLQEKVKETADRGKIAVIGPNCLGAGNVRADLNATFFPHPVPPRKGKVSFVSQSGGVVSLLLYRSADSNLGLSKFASVGNRVNIDFHDLIRYYRDDPETDVIGLFIEGTGHAREMAEEIAKTTPDKPVVVFKVGKTPTSKQAALSHTGSLAGNADLYSAAIKQAGGLEVESIQEMIDAASVLSICKARPKGKRVAVITHSLGIALIAAQTLELHGAELPMPDNETVEVVQGLLDMPVEIPVKNPIDLLAKGWAEPRVFAEAFKHVVQSDTYDAVLTVFSPNYQEGIGGGMPVDEVVSAAKKADKPVVSVLNSPADRKPPGREELEDGGIPFFASPQRAGRALATVLRLASKK
ncbi:MAG: hypothetical protein GF411_01280 [Candidatus Lokiarchaeota archaeon]|nr:hypothetical protein [Candidatus Lokiarchaeota archaeon]